MKTYNVYRVDYVKHSRVPLGSVAERRRKNRPNNFLGLLKVARKAYGHSPNYDVRIVLDKSALMESGREIA